MWTGDVVSPPLFRPRLADSDELLAGPIRGDLLGAERLAARARAVARDQQSTTARRPFHPAPLLARLDQTSDLLAEAHARLIRAVAEDVDAGPAADWLLDNYHVVQEQLDAVRVSLPKGFYRELPELTAGTLTGYPRVYEIAISLISHTEARIDLENVDLFVEAFQSVQPLSIGELWAMPAMLRLGLLESVRRMTLRTVSRVDDLVRAVAEAERIRDAHSRGGPYVRMALRAFADAHPPLSPHFVSRFLQALRQTEGASIALEWLEHWLQDAGVRPEQAVAESTQRLALTQRIMANSITSLRDIGRRDWRAFVEQQSAMDAVLRTDPDGTYPLMTFATRDQYRHVVERIAKRTQRQEVLVAAKAIELAQHDATTSFGAGARSSHVGYYLIDDGLAQLEVWAGYSPTLGERLTRWTHRHPHVVFLGGIALCTTVALLLVRGWLGPWTEALGWLVWLVMVLPVLDLGIATVNQLIMALVPPRVLPRLEAAQADVMDRFPTVVVMPTLFGSVADVQSALERLEVQYLANREVPLHFAILSDFTDAPVEDLPGDPALLEAATVGMRRLNERYAADGPSRFLLLHRRRQWNAAQGVWMGWERKRGKLAAFNHLLRVGDRAAFPIIHGDVSLLVGTAFVITLDADTVLPQGGAAALIGTLAHPLNRPVHDATQQRVTCGYGILQPRVGISLPSAHASRFAAIASGHPGVDPYSMASSDVYQDLYGEGSYTGKGIYDVDAFEQVTRRRFPENRLLSHDLLEGNYARAGLVTDIVVYDDYPATYLSYTWRKHRWIRGDWQLLGWLRRRAPGAQGREPNHLSLLARWKILDNLRRSTTELSQLLLFLAAWTVLPGSALGWTLFALAMVAAPWAMSLPAALLRNPIRTGWRAHLAAVAEDAWLNLQQAFVALVVLPHQAAISADAIGRTLYRVYWSHRYLLEWRSAAVVEQHQTRGAADIRRAMQGAIASVAVVALAITAYALAQEPLTLASPASRWTPVVAMWAVVLLWLSSPWLVGRWSGPLAPPRRPLTASEQALVRGYAARHWAYFERFVTADSHWLAPDNVQEDPVLAVAMRTSPTNIGLQLLSTMSAHDLGFITAEEMTAALERAVATMRKLRLHRGHFLNWYDLHTLRVLEPAYVSTVDSGNLAGHLLALRQGCRTLARQEPALAERLRRLADQARDWVAAMDFGFLYDRERKLFTIGFHPETQACDGSFYDLLASEARLASFVAIAKSDVPVEHWFRLSRSLTRAGHLTTLVSWSGSMFEYLMPLLVMRSLDGTLLDQTHRAAVGRHRRYGRTLGVPWGISESLYNVRDHEQTYQYRAFGVPDLALKRGLGRDVVVAPYASALAALVDPERALANLQELDRLGALGTCGFRDALDYTRPAEGRRYAVASAYMAHHVGMTLTAFTNLLVRDIWQDRFHADPLVKAAELLLHERMPRLLVLRPVEPTRADESTATHDVGEAVVRHVPSADFAVPRVALLGSGPYTVMLNHSGTGYSRYESLAITRWRADRTSDDTGQFCYLKDLTTGRIWSAGTAPVDTVPEVAYTDLALDRVAMHRTDGEIETRTEITVVPGDAAEVRRVTLTNLGRAPHDIELTSYGEIVLAPGDADRAHPAFSNLFVETEWHAWCTAITAFRRPRAPSDLPRWCVHVVDDGHDPLVPVTCETDRARFIGRGRSVRRPIALDTDGALSGTTGAVLDPVMALRTRVRVLPGQPVSVTFTTLVTTSRDDAFVLADRYHDLHAADRAFDVAWTVTQIELRELDLAPASAALFQDLATQLLYGRGSLGPPPDERRRNRSAQPRLWTHGISGDLPIVLATIDSMAGLPTLRELCMAHRYWRRRGLRVDLVVVNGQTHDYLQELRDGITDAIASSDDAALLDQPAGTFVRRRDAFPPDDYLMLAASARLQIPCDGRSLARILAAAELRATKAAGVTTAERGGALATLVSVLKPLVAATRLSAARPVPPGSATTLALPPLRYANGIGGLDTDDSYLMHVDAEALPPTPWINVIANAQGGCLVSESGPGCTWAENAYFYRLTPWHNDPVVDPVSDALYLQDVETGDLWGPTPAPVRRAGVYRVRHTPGLTTFEHEHAGIGSSLTIGMPETDAVRLSVLRLTNRTERPRSLALTAFVEWTLGPRREVTQHQVRTRYLTDDHAMLADNSFDLAFMRWVAFLATSEPVTSYSADRATFLGAGGALPDPAALRRSALDGHTGVEFDPCAALQMRIELAPGETREIALQLGAAPSEGAARDLVRRYRTPAAASNALAQARRRWEDRLGTIRVQTPDAAFDAMLNTWTLYQATSCRMWARTGLYQSSGAYGFRDQLQDAMALVYAEPALARAQLLRAAARQFVEGDVQHWWHPHTGRGVRTRFSDDLVWLPYVVDHYVRVTGDTAVLDEVVPFLRSDPLTADEHERYELPLVADDQATLFEHCLRAIRRGSTQGAHGLPLIGTGDWNDGFSLVGADGRGESVWLAWFLVSTLRAFAERVEARGAGADAATLRAQAAAYVNAAEAHGWDGRWYRRAFYDDGTAMGSAGDSECRIDSIAQSWSVISGAGRPDRQAAAMRAVEASLVRDDDALILLLTPPFDRGARNPGYIKGYLPGVRENGAQYTHAALWVVMATAMRGDGDRAFALYQMLNPLTHSDTPERMQTYKVEPYVVAADVYTAPGQLGRGGWTWYTGSASWMYRVGLEQLLGFTKLGDTLRIVPTVPAEWPGFSVTYRFGTATYEIEVRAPARIRPHGARIHVDGVSHADAPIALVDDGQRHVVVIEGREEPMPAAV
jgi:cyclic beta-1,2-glucan synthetase